MNSDYDYMRILGYEDEIRKLKDSIQYLEAEINNLAEENEAQKEYITVLENRIGMMEMGEDW